MSIWRKVFGIDAFDVILQSVITGVLIFWITATNSHQDAIIGGSVVSVASLVVLGVRRKLALRRAGRELSDAEGMRVAELEQRVAELEHELGRMLELEERLDFAERLLATSHQAATKELAP